MRSPSPSRSPPPYSHLGEEEAAPIKIATRTRRDPKPYRTQARPRARTRDPRVGEEEERGLEEGEELRGCSATSTTPT
jgi:hypothetical protein